MKMHYMLNGMICRTHSTTKGKHSGFAQTFPGGKLFEPEKLGKFETSGTITVRVISSSYSASQLVTKTFAPDDLHRILLGHYKAALATFSKIEEETSEEDWQIFHNKGLALRGLERYQESIEQFQIANSIRRHDSTFMELAQVRIFLAFD